MFTCMLRLCTYIYIQAQAMASTLYVASTALVIKLLAHFTEGADSILFRGDGGRQFNSSPKYGKSLEEGLSLIHI